MAWVTTWEEDQPLVGDPANQAHIDMQLIMKGIRERLAVEHDATDGDDTDTYIHLENSARCDVTIAVGARNAAGTAGRMHFATGTGALTIDDGSNWQDLNPADGILATEFGGTGQNFSGSTGFIYLTGGTCSAVGPSQSVVLSGGVLKLFGDESSPGNYKVYGTDSDGTKGWQDVVGGVFDPDGDGLVDPETGGTGQDFSGSTGIVRIDGGTFSVTIGGVADTYTVAVSAGDESPNYLYNKLTAGQAIGLSTDDSTVSIAVGRANSIVELGGLLQLDGDETNPGNNQLYGTTNAGAKGWRALTEITMIVDAQYDSTTGKFQVKTQTGFVLAPGTVSDWTDVFTAVECP